MSNETNPSPSAPAEPRAKRSKPSFSAGHYFLLVVFVGVALLVLTDNMRTFAQYLYRPYSFFILIVIGAMYLLQKGSDRSRMYRIELRAIRRRRIEEQRFFREVEADLKEAARKMGIVDSEGDSPPEDNEIERGKRDLADILQRMSDRA